jgi:hypothetical protein
MEYQYASANPSRQSRRVGLLPSMDHQSSDGIIELGSIRTLEDVKGLYQRLQLVTVLETFYVVQGRCESVAFGIVLKLVFVELTNVDVTIRR